MITKKQILEIRPGVSNFKTKNHETAFKFIGFNSFYCHHYK